MYKKELQYRKGQIHKSKYKFQRCL